MAAENISAKDPYPRKRIKILESEIAYVDTGSGDPVVFMHGNPTSSYLWRNVIPHVEPYARCLAPDLLGMGDSDKSPANSYRVPDQLRYFDAWFDALGLTKNVTLVVQDWGVVIGFDWARCHRERVKALIHMEGIIRTMKWEEWALKTRDAVRMLKHPNYATAEEYTLGPEDWVAAKFLPLGIIRQLTDEEKASYRRPYQEPGMSRKPLLDLGRGIPIEGDPPDVCGIVDASNSWLMTLPIPKLFINAEPGLNMVGAARETCRKWPNQKEVTVHGIHFLPEDSPRDIGRHIAEFLQALKG